MADLDNKLVTEFGDWLLSIGAYQQGNWIHGVWETYIQLNWYPNGTKLWSQVSEQQARDAREFMEMVLKNAVLHEFMKVLLTGGGEDE